MVSIIIYEVNQRSDRYLKKFKTRLLEGELFDKTQYKTLVRSHTLNALITAFSTTHITEHSHA